MRPRGRNPRADCPCSERASPLNCLLRLQALENEGITMKDAKTLLLEFLAAVTGGRNASALFAEDGAVELPFLYSLGIPWRHRGRQAISALQDSLAGLYLDFAFKPEDPRPDRHSGTSVRRVHGASEDE